MGAILKAVSWSIGVHQIHLRAAFPILARALNKQRSTLRLLSLLALVCIQAASFAAPPTRRPAENGQLRLTRDGHHLALDKNALTRAFLLRASLIPQRMAATGEGKLSRIVYFIRRGSRVFLMESTQGQVTTSDLPASLILAEIPIISETRQSLVIDFNAGMQQVFTASNWYGSDFEGTEFDADVRAEGARVQHSFLEPTPTSRRVGQEVTEVRQVVQFNHENNFPTYEVRYYFSPYRPNTAFQVRENPPRLPVAFFETAPNLDGASGRTTTPITRWDISNPNQPIVYYISANTPQEYVEAVREGILYWNKAFGREVLRAELAPANVTAPSHQQNIVQWVPYDTAGFAYADALSDPHTGQILNAQIFLTSVFAFGTKQDVRELLRRHALTHNEAPNSNQRSRAFHNHDRRSRGFRRNALCRFNVLHHLTPALEQLLADPNITDEILKRIARDVIRDVTAHEVGHTLGLRHNFAGKLDAAVTLSRRDELFTRYLTNGELPPSDAQMSSSVMDYLPLSDSVLFAATMNTRERALPYDEMAIQWGYGLGRFAAPQPPAIDRALAPIFCTDSSIGIYRDCDVFTSGPKPILFHTAQIQSLAQGLPHALIEAFIQNRSPLEARDAIPVAEVRLPSRAWVSAHHVTQLLSWLDADTRSAYVERRLPFIDATNAQQIQAETLRWVTAQVSEAGGVESVFFGLLKSSPNTVGLDVLSTTWVADMMQAFNDQLSSIQTTGYLDPHNQRQVFAPEEVTIMRSRAESYFKRYQTEMVDELLDAYTHAKLTREVAANHFVALDGLTAQFENTIGPNLGSIILERSDRRIEASVRTSQGLQPTIMLRGFRFSAATRLKAMRLLQAEGRPTPSWALEARRDVVTKLREIVENSIGLDIHAVNVHELGPAARDWYLEQIHLLEVVGDELGCSELLEPREKSKKERRR